ncbi:hypothetical protein LINPERHAP1_LOCUS2129, partial [Linum perenne]
GLRGVHPSFSYYEIEGIGTHIQSRKVHNPPTSPYIRE